MCYMNYDHNKYLNDQYACSELCRLEGKARVVEPEGRIDRINMILEGLVQVVQDTHNNNHDNAP